MSTDLHTLRRSRSRGMSLMELLAVLVIVSVLMGLSAAVYWRISRGFKEQGAAADLDIILRQARNSAVAANAPAFVAIDAETKTITPWVYKTVGLWHFEDRTSYGQTNGAYHRATMRGAELFPEGKIGKCVRLRDNVYVDCGEDPDFDCEDGGYLEAYIRPTVFEFTGDHYVFSKKDAYYLKVTRGGVLQAGAGGSALKAEHYRVVPGRWTKVAFAWDLQSARIMVDDAVVAYGRGGRPPLNSEPLLIGHETVSLQGLVDEARVMSATRGNRLELPRLAKVEHTAAPWNTIHFAADGALDLRYHAGPVAVTLIHEQRARTVSVSMLGQVTRGEVERKEELAARRASESSGGQGPGLTLYGADGKPAGGNAPKGDGKKSER